jgi:hypothetical protein
LSENWLTWECPPPLGSWRLETPAQPRDTAVEAFEAWMAWDGTGPEPTVEFEVNYVPRPISLSRAMGLVWNCTDIVPGYIFDTLVTEEMPVKSPTYAACARAILDDIKNRAA